MPVKGYEEPYEMLQSMAVYQGLHRLLKTKTIFRERNEILFENQHISHVLTLNILGLCTNPIKDK